MNIVVLCGGLSPERNVSVSSARRITQALKNLGHRAVLIDMYFGLEGCNLPLNDVFDLPLPAGEDGVDESEPDLTAVSEARVLRSKSLFGERVLELCAAADLVFMALHGRCGEDGRVQAAFDLLGIRYTGSGYLGSTLAIDKRLTKIMAERIGIKTPDWMFCPPGGPCPAEDFPLPCVVKPVDSGSSIGVNMVETRRELDLALEDACTRGESVIVEKRISGREIQVSILGGAALPSIEIRPRCGFYDYHNKYQPGAADEITPAPIPPEGEYRLARAATAIYSALGLRALARADFIMDGDGNFWFLEINTLPGMTPTSLAPQEAAAAGLSYEQLCQRIVELAFAEEEATV